MNFQYIEDDYSNCPYNSFHSIETVMSLKQNGNDKGKIMKKGKFIKKPVKKG